MSNLMIYQTKESNIEFAVEASGVDTDDMTVKFVIETKDMDLCFKCTSTDKKTWVCKVQPLKFLEKTTYPYRIEVCAEGYYLKGATGTVTITTTAELYTTEPKNTTITAPASDKEDTSAKKIKLSKAQKEEKPTEVKESVIDKDSLVKSILKETNGDRNKTVRKSLFNR